MESVQTSRPIFKYNLLGMGFSGVLQFAGFVTPGWVTFRNERDGNAFHSGLWYIVVCADTCKKSSVNKGFEGDYNPYRPWQIQTTIALLACLIAIVSLIIARNMTGARQYKRLTIVAYCSVVSGLLSLIPAGYYADIQISNGSSATTRYLFPYSLFLTGFGGIIALVISLISLYIGLSKQTTNEPRADVP